MDVVSKANHEWHISVWDRGNFSLGISAKIVAVVLKKSLKYNCGVLLIILACDNINWTS